MMKCKAIMKRRKTHSYCKANKNHTWSNQDCDTLLQLKQKLNCDVKENTKKRRNFWNSKVIQMKNTKGSLKVATKSKATKSNPKDLVLTYGNVRKAKALNQYKFNFQVNNHDFKRKSKILTQRDFKIRN